MTGQAGASIVLLEWGKYFRRDSWAGQAAVARFAPRKALTLLQVDRHTYIHTYIHTALGGRLLLHERLS